MAKRWPLGVLNIGTYVEHRDDVPWWEAPIPWRWHRCRKQTRGIVDGRTIYRCPCGAINVGGFWMEKNARRPRKASR